MAVVGAAGAAGGAVAAALGAAGLRVVAADERRGQAGAATWRVGDVAGSGGADLLAGTDVVVLVCAADDLAAVLASPPAGRGWSGPPAPSPRVQPPSAHGGSSS